MLPRPPLKTIETEVAVSKACNARNVKPLHRPKDRLVSEVYQKALAENWYRAEYEIWLVRFYMYSPKGFKQELLGLLLPTRSTYDQFFNFLNIAIINVLIAALG